MIAFAMPGSEHLGRVALDLRSRLGAVDLHRFPDGECRIRLLGEAKGQQVVLLASLDRPDHKLLPMLFAAATARDLGAASVGLVAPYLPYLRQDHRFAPGEGISARYFADLLSQAVDWLATVDPHLHRIHSLADVLTVPAEAVHAAPLLAGWIRDHVDHPLILGPDRESLQWVLSVARLAGAPHAVLDKRRTGDRRVQITLPELARYAGRQLVLVDDVISSGATMAAATHALRSRGWPAPICVAVHAVFGDGARAALRDAGVSRIVTSNTIPDASNAVDVHGLLADAVARRLVPRPASGALV